MSSEPISLNVGVQRLSRSAPSARAPPWKPAAVTQRPRPGRDAGEACTDGRPLRRARYGRNLAGKLPMMPLLSMSAISSACSWTFS